MKTIAMACAVIVLGCTRTASTPAPANTPSGVTAAAESYGSSVATAIEVCEPRGEREYLSRLRCPDGTAPKYSRRGSGPLRSAPTKPEHQKMMMEQISPRYVLQPGEPDFHVIDYYEVTCRDRTVTLVLDMYHCNVTADQAPPGFTIVGK